MGPHFWAGWWWVGLMWLEPVVALLLLSKLLMHNDRVGEVTRAAPSGEGITVTLWARDESSSSDLFESVAKLWIVGSPPAYLCVWAFKGTNIGWWAGCFLCFILASAVVALCNWIAACDSWIAVLLRFLGRCLFWGTVLIVAGLPIGAFINPNIKLWNPYYLDLIPF